MTDDEFAALVARLEERAQRNPSGYQSRALLLAIGGNAYLAGVLVLIAGLIVTLLALVTVLKAVAVKFVIVFGGFLWMVLRAVWIRLPAPEGIEVKRHEAPELFALVDGLRDALRSPRFHHVLVTGDFNAAVCQVPRLGIFAGTRNYLLLGLPLMKTLGIEQFRSVLAHEFGHLARGHGRVSNWIYCQRLRWARLAASLDEAESRGKWLFDPLFKRFVPYFTAYSFPLARANEYQADAAAARLTSTRATSEALTAVNVIGSYLHERYWPAVHRDVADLPQPRFLPFAGLTEKFPGDLDEASTSRWLQDALGRRTDCTDTHPSLTDRLRAIGEPPRLVPPAPGEAADRLLGAALERVTRQLDEDWRATILPGWEAHHRSVQEERQRFAALEASVAAGDTLEFEDRVQHAILAESVASQPERAIDLLRGLVAAEPDHAGAAFALGARLLARGDDDGIELLERVMSREPGSVPQLAVMLRDHAARKGLAEDAKRWHDRAVDAAERLGALEREQSTIRLTDTFARHELDPSDLARLRQALAAVPHLKRAYLVRKRVAVEGDVPIYSHVLGFSVSAWTSSSRTERSAEASAALQQVDALPPGTLLVPVDGANYRFGRKFFWMRGARVR